MSLMGSVNCSNPNELKNNNIMTDLGKFAEYKIIHIQNVTPVVEKQTQVTQYEKKIVDDMWKRKLCSCKQYKCICEMNVLYSAQNCDSNVMVRNNPFFDTFCRAYDNHGDVMISPDDVWMVITLYFAKYVNDNAEKMRDKFVSHQGKKKLQVTTQSEIDESQWDEFFELMIKAINDNTKDDVVDLLQCNFTSTTALEKVLSTATVMDTFKQYFSYGRCIPCCGIRNVYFAGSYDDWTKVLEKLKKLEKYAVTPQLTNYIKNLSPVVQQFINTYNGKVDVNFWNRVVNRTYGSLGSGSTCYISGWILNFFGLAGEVEEVPLNSINVEIEIDNRLTGVKKTVNLLGGFSGVNKTEDIYKPQLSLAIIHKIK